MAQSNFPEGVSKEIPEEKTPVQKAVEELMAIIMKPINEFEEGWKKVNDYAAEGRRVNLEH